MVLTGSLFFLFLASVYVAYWLISRFRFAGLAILFLANAVFLARWSPAYLVLIPAAATADFFIARALARLTSPLPRRVLITVSILINLGLIALVKYLPQGYGYTLPLGLSFYAFQALTYTIDIFRNDATPVSSYFTYLTAVTFFPTMVAGPITRVSKLVPQLQRPAALTPAEGGTALFLIGAGLVKKLLIADYLAENLVNRVFDLPNLYSAGDVLAATYAYAFQIYYDFSGYSDIAIGAALLLGLKLPKNFDRPYASENISEFWRRWHITFSFWLRDYLYFALPGKRTRLMPYLNLIITMALGGLWHGIGWTFLIWGLLHGTAQAAYRLYKQSSRYRKPAPALRALRIIATFHFVLLTWVFFRAANLTTARDIFARLASLHFTFDNVTRPYALVLALAATLHFLPKSWYARASGAFVESPFYVQAAAMAAIAVALQKLGGTGSSPFIYSRF